MTSYSVNKVVGYAERVADFFTRNKPAMLAKGFDATQDIAAITAGAAALPASSEDQLNDMTSQTQDSGSLADEIAAAYQNGSRTLNAASGRFGKRSDEATEAQRVREGCKSKSSAAQVSAFLVEVVAYLTKHKTDLTAANYDPTAKITELTALSTTLIGDKGAQQQAMTDRGNATTAVQTAKDSLYQLANNALETAMGLFPADSEFVNEAERIRLEIHGPHRASKKPPAPATQPTTAPPAA